MKKRPRKKTGEAALFFEIWIDRPHYCQHCGHYLGEQPKAHFFHHIKSKGAHPALRLEPENIELVCMDCHPE